MQPTCERPWPRVRTILQLAAALTLMTAVSGCAANLTDFNFPRFGLTDQDKRHSQLPLEQPQSSRLIQQY